MGMALGKYGYNDAAYTQCATDSPCESPSLRYLDSHTAPTIGKTVRSQRESPQAQSAAKKMRVHARVESPANARAPTIRAPATINAATRQAHKTLAGPRAPAPTPSVHFRAPWFDHHGCEVAYQKRMLLHAQRFLIEKYAALYEMGFVCLASTDFRTDATLCNVRGSPFQDPVGALFHALMLLRLVKPPTGSKRAADANTPSAPSAPSAPPKATRQSPTSITDSLGEARAVDPGPAEHDARPLEETTMLSRKYRLLAAALLSVSHKFTTNAPPLKNVKLNLEWIKTFLCGSERPRFSFEVETAVGASAHKPGGARQRKRRLV